MKISVFSILLCCCLSTNLFAQHHGCGQHSTPEQIAFLTAQNPNLQVSRKSSTDTIFVPILFHRVADTLGNGAITEAQVDDALAYLNELYAEGKIVFKRCQKDNFISSDRFFNYKYADEFALRQAHEVAGVINIFVPNGVESSSGSQLCGYAYLPPTRRDICMVKKSCFLNGTTLAHEVGHYLGLYHTHGKSNCGSLTDELADGSNCDDAGDDVCDTPADPNLLGDECNAYEVNRNCAYTGTRLDDAGQAFSPDTRNIMSYSRKACRQHFSLGQLDRVRFFLETSRSYLKCQDCPTEMPTVEVIERGYLQAKAQVTGVRPGSMLVVEVSSASSTQPFTFETSSNPIPISGFEPCDSFSFRIKEKCSTNSAPWSQPKTIVLRGCDQAYCVQPHYDRMTMIENLSVNDVNLPTLYGLDGYGLHAGVQPILVPSQMATQTLEVPVKCVTSFRRDVQGLEGYFQVWFDENNNQEFEADERLEARRYTDGQEVVVTLPIKPSTPRNVALRVRMSVGVEFFMGPCDPELGETEDFQIVVEDAFSPAVAWMKDTIVISPREREFYVPMMSNANWTLEGDQMWITPEQRAGDTSAASISFNTSRNMGCADRVASFELVNGVARAQLMIVQKAPMPKIEAIHDDIVSISPEGGILGLTSTSMHVYAVEGADWLAGMSAGQLLDTNTVESYIESNESEVERNGVLRYAGCGVEKLIEIVQPVAYTSWRTDSTISLSSIDSTFQIDVESNVRWTLSANVDWLEVPLDTFSGSQVVTIGKRSDAPANASGQLVLQPLFGNVTGEVELNVTTNNVSGTEQALVLDLSIGNPFADRLYATTNAADQLEMHIYASTGQLIETTYGNLLDLDTSDWPAGAYVLRIVNPEGKVLSKTLIRK